MSDSARFSRSTLIFPFINYTILNKFCQSGSLNHRRHFEVSCLLRPPHPASFPFLFTFHSQDGLPDVQRLPFQPGIATALHIVRPLFALQLAGVHRSIVAQAMGVGRIYRGLVFWENSCPQGIQIRMGVHIADVFCRVPTSQLPPVGHHAVILAVAGNGDKENKESYMCRMPLNRLPQNACGSFMKQGFRMFKGLGAKSMTLIASDRTFCPDNVQADCKLSTKIRPHLSCGLITCYCR